ncbi:MAG: hypothetical protein NTZ56_12370 [Acidobacteria bacterium]|nr:hypothetical protein [Acidobacteriota bacterium]
MTFLTVVISAAALIVTAVGVMVGVAAIWGYAAIRKGVLEISQKASREATASFLKGPEITAFIAQEVRQYAASAVDDWKASQEMVASQPAQEQDTIKPEVSETKAKETVGKPYQKKTGRKHDNPQ